MAEEKPVLFYGRLAIIARSQAEARRVFGHTQKDIVKAVIDTDIHDFSFGMYDAKGNSTSTYKQGDVPEPPNSITVIE